MKQFLKPANLSNLTINLYSWFGQKLNVDKSSIQIISWKSRKIKLLDALFGGKFYNLFDGF